MYTFMNLCIANLGGGQNRAEKRFRLAQLLNKLPMKELTLDMNKHVADMGYRFH